MGQLISSELKAYLGEKTLNHLCYNLKKTKANQAKLKFKIKSQIKQLIK